MRTAESVYRRFIQFEEKAASIYLRLASHFSSDQKLSWFWVEMAMEEKQHAGLLQFCLAEGLFAEDLPSKAEIEKFMGVFSEMERRAADPKLSVNEAFALAIEMETTEINAIYRHLTTTLHSSMYLLKRKIATCVPDHVEQLIEGARKFGASNKIIKEASRLQQTA